MSTLDFIYVVALLTAVVTAPFLIASWLIYVLPPEERRVFPMKSTVLFTSLIIICFLVSWTSMSIAKHKLLQSLRSLSAKSTVSINGKEVQNRDEILNTLRGLRYVVAHHSSPTREFQVEISDPPQKLLLLVARDSDNPQEYWVRVPSPSRLAARAAYKKDIGHIITKVFDVY